MPLCITGLTLLTVCKKIWKDAAKALTLEAAEKAGLGTTDTIQLMSEPDAAAAWTLLRDISPNNLKVR